MGFITKDGLDNLKKYKYISGGYSPIDKIMNHWWEYVATWIPMVFSFRMTLSRVWHLT
jgi:hypothetical protein